MLLAEEGNVPVICGSLVSGFSLNKGMYHNPATVKCAAHISFFLSYASASAYKNIGYNKR